MTALERPSGQVVDRRIAILMGLEAATLAVASFVHLAGGAPAGSTPPFDAGEAGVAEAIIGAVLAVGAIAVARGVSRARTAALAASSFAIVGFLVGLRFTAEGGDDADLAYHLAMLPVLVVTLVLVVRSGRREVPRGR
jgi:hypothetical protein